MPREAAIVGRILRELDRRGTWWIKTHGAGMGRNGTPDILACHHGRFIGIEAKAPRGQVAKLQAYELERITRAGGTGIVVRTIDQLTAALDHIEALTSTDQQEGA